MGPSSVIWSEFLFLLLIQATRFFEPPSPISDQISDAENVLKVKWAKNLCSINRKLIMKYF